MTWWLKDIASYGCSSCGKRATVRLRDCENFDHGAYCTPCGEAEVERRNRLLCAPPPRERP